MSQNEKISIDGKILQMGVLYTPETGGYQIYVYPGMTVAEMAFDTMVMIRLLIQDGCIKNKKEFDDLVKKYFADPQYRPLEMAIKPQKDEVN